jgi:tetratricopeptide (TPR) repeat protein
MEPPFIGRTLPPAGSPSATEPTMPLGTPTRLPGPDMPAAEVTVGGGDGPSEGRTRGKAAVIGAIVGVTALVAAGAVAVVKITGNDSDGGAASPSDVGTSLTTALDNEDFDRAEQLARALVERHQDDRSARSLLQMVRIERAVAAEEISSADGLLKDARAQGFDIEPTTELGVAELWLSEGEPQRSLEIAERVLKELDAPPASSAADGKDAGPADAEEDAEYRRYVRGVALLVRGLCRAELGDPASAVVDLTAAVQLAPDEETAADWSNYLDQVREKSR